MRPAKHQTVGPSLGSGQAREQGYTHNHPLDSWAAVTVEASGVLRLDGDTEALKPEVIARSKTLSNIVDSAAEGDTSPLPITWGMLAAWRSAMTAAGGSPAMEKLSLSSQLLGQALAAADAMADEETIETMCAAQTIRVRHAMATGGSTCATISPTASSGAAMLMDRGPPGLADAPPRPKMSREDAKKGAEAARASTHSSPLRAAASVCNADQVQSILHCGSMPAADQVEPPAQTQTSAAAMSFPPDASTRSDASQACGTSVHTAGQHTQHAQHAVAVADLQLLELKEESAPLPVDCNAHKQLRSSGRDCVYSEVAPLPWLEQVASSAPPQVVLKLLHAAFPHVSSVQELQPLLEGKSAHLQALTLQACLPRIDTHGEFEATMRDGLAARCVANVLPLLPTLRALRLHLGGMLNELGQPGCTASRPSDASDAMLDCIKHAGSPQMHLKALHLSLGGCSLTPRHTSALAGALSQNSALESLSIEAGNWGPHGACVAAPGLARQICKLTRLTRLELGGTKLPCTLWGELAAGLTALSALQELRIEDGTADPAHVDDITASAARLPGLTSLHIGGMTPCDSPARRSVDAAAERRRVVSDVFSAPHLQALSVRESEDCALSAWLRGSLVFEARAAGSALTRLDLVRCLSTSVTDVQGLRGAAAFMPHLQTLRLEFTAGGDVRHERDKRRAQMRSKEITHLLHEISVKVPGLHTLRLVGVLVHPQLASVCVGVLAEFPNLQTLELRDAVGESWAPAAEQLVGLIGSGSRLTGLRELLLHSEEVSFHAAMHLLDAMNTLTALTSLGFDLWVTQPSRGRIPAEPIAWDSSLRLLTGLRRLALGAAHFDMQRLNNLRLRLETLTRLTELRLQYRDIPGEAEPGNVSERLREDPLLELLSAAGPLPAATPPDRRDAGGGGSAVRLPQLEVLVLDNLWPHLRSRKGLQMLGAAAGRMPRLRDVRVGGRLLCDASLFLEWPVRVTSMDEC